MCNLQYHLMTHNSLKLPAAPSDITLARLTDKATTKDAAASSL